MDVPANETMVIAMLRQCHARREDLESRLRVVSDLWDEMARLSMARPGFEAPLHILGDAVDVVAFRAAARRLSVVLRELNAGSDGQ